MLMPLVRRSQRKGRIQASASYEIAWTRTHNKLTILAHKIPQNSDSNATPINELIQRLAANIFQSDNELSWGSYSWVIERVKVVAGVSSPGPGAGSPTSRATVPPLKVDFLETIKFQKLAGNTYDGEENAASG